VVQLSILDAPPCNVEEKMGYRKRALQPFAPQSVCFLRSHIALLLHRHPLTTVRIQNCSHLTLLSILHTSYQGY
jgi:hypothetical protein